MTLHDVGRYLRYREKNPPLETLVHFIAAGFGFKIPEEPNRPETDEELAAAAAQINRIMKGQ